MKHFTSWFISSSALALLTSNLLAEAKEVSRSRSTSCVASLRTSSTSPSCGALGSISRPNEGVVYNGVTLQDCQDICACADSECHSLGWQDGWKGGVKGRCTLYTSYLAQLGFQPATVAHPSTQPDAGERPGRGEHPSAWEHPGAGEHPGTRAPSSTGEQSGVSERPSAGQHPGTGHHPGTGQRQHTSGREKRHNRPHGDPQQSKHSEDYRPSRSVKGQGSSKDTPVQGNSIFFDRTCFHKIKPTASGAMTQAPSTTKHRSGPTGAPTSSPAAPLTHPQPRTSSPDSPPHASGPHPSEPPRAAKPHASKPHASGPHTPEPQGSELHPSDPHASQPQAFQSDQSQPHNSQPHNSWQPGPHSQEQEPQQSSPGEHDSAQHGFPEHAAPQQDAAEQHFPQHDSSANRHDKHLARRDAKAAFEDYLMEALAGM